MTCALQNPQPRQDRLREIDELAASIQKDGLLHPIVVTEKGTATTLSPAKDATML